jgi:VanZ family protein
MPTMAVRVPLAPAWLRWIAALVVIVVIFYSSVLSTPPATVLDTRPSLLPLDKWRHFLAYAALGYTLAYATTDWPVERRVAALAVIATTVGYGIGLELVQSQVGRTFSVADAYANALGGLLVAPYYLLQPRLQFEPVESFFRSLHG